MKLKAVHPYEAQTFEELIEEMVSKRGFKIASAARNYIRSRVIRYDATNYIFPPVVEHNRPIWYEKGKDGFYRLWTIAN